MGSSKVSIFTLTSADFSSTREDAPNSGISERAIISSGLRNASKISGFLLINSLKLRKEVFTIVLTLLGDMKE